MYFKKELATIENEEIRQQCIEVLKHVNEKFFTEAASTTGKYHPQYALGEGGLYRHTCAAVRIANHLLSLKYAELFDDDDTKDYVRAALILHDCCKCGIEWESKYTKHEHPNLAAELIKHVLGDCDFTRRVGDLVKCHMGQWATSNYSDVILEQPFTSSELLVHICDYLASRKDIEVLFD